MKFENLMDVFHHELRDLHDAEKQLVEALPKMAQAASHGDLKEAFEHHLEETKGHVQRVDDALGELGKSGSSEECKGMKGLIAEGEEVIGMQGDPMAKDAALIAAAQRVEHYEIAAYGTVKTLAKELDLSEIEDLMDQTLDEESQADTLLTKIATGGMLSAGVNQRAGEGDA